MNQIDSNESSELIQPNHLIFFSIRTIDLIKKILWIDLAEPEDLIPILITPKNKAVFINTQTIGIGITAAAATSKFFLILIYLNQFNLIQFILM